MGCLAAINYDPATAASYATTAALAMTAFDTTNLAATFTAPASGNVLVRIHCLVTGATTMPTILLGVLSSGTGSVLLRTSPTGGLKNTALATAYVDQEIEGVITGLTSGTSYTFDAAYGVETGVASTAIKCGGPNDTTANNAWGALQFEVWSA